MTEDCDLGVRLFMEGHQTAVINSTTLEEANSKFKNWLRQRSRWIKGYMQTYLVHMRNPYQLVRKQGVHALVFNLVVGGKIAFMFINPLLWIATIAYFTLNSIVGPTIESLYPPYIFYMALFSLVFGNFLYMFYYMIGCAKRDHWSVIKYVYLVPFYWIMTSIAATIALQQLFFKPHYWEKTVHGLHLKQNLDANVNVRIRTKEVIKNRTRLSMLVLRLRQSFIDKRKVFISGIVLVGGMMGANLINFVFNAYLGRQLDFTEFGELSLFISLLYFVSIPLGSYSATISHNIGYLSGKYSKDYARGYLDYIFLKSLAFGVVITVIWAIFIPFLSNFFQTRSMFPILIFTPIWIISFFSSNISGYLAGTLSFGKKGAVLLSESAIRLIFAFLLIFLGLSEYINFSILFSLFASTVLGWILIKGKKPLGIRSEEKKFNFPFFITSNLSGISVISFLTLDIILVKHFLNPESAGQYGLLSLIGKMTYFLGSLFGPFMIPLVAHNLGANRTSKNTFKFLFFITLGFSIFSFLVLGVFGGALLPTVFGSKVLVIAPLLVPYVLSMALFTTSQPIVSYFQAHKNYSFAIVGFLIAIVQIVLTYLFHENIDQVVAVMLATSALNLLLAVLVYLFRERLGIVQSNLKDFFELLVIKSKSEHDLGSENKKILIFNWRDTKHIWGGGAEAYIHEIAKRWISDGYSVTVFCGNDGKSTRNDVVDGVRVVRRGGFYTVYFWAFVYYILKFRGKFDVVIDSENGLPFFTPLFVRVPKFLLIHHIHQEVFRTQLRFPFKNIAMLLESKLMPLVYRNQRVITVSESSKKEILKMRLSRFKSIEVINPGINSSDYKRKSKSSYLSLLYLGRLKPYKNVDVALRAFAEILKTNKKAVFYVAGVGESLKGLQQLADELQISESVKFLGRVTETEKSELLASVWVMVQPSMIEGWGITVIEANASGTPVIASDVNGLRDSISDGKTGMLVKVRDSMDLAEKIRQITKSPKVLKSFSDEAYVWSKNFSWAKSAGMLMSSIETSIDEINQTGKNERLIDVDDEVLEINI